MDKTCKVSVETKVRHSRYKKLVPKRRFFFAHIGDEIKSVEVGDTVEILESRPMSKLKRWKVVNVISHIEE
jgi:small subunit ribosomal protein S17